MREELPARLRGLLGRGGAVMVAGFAPGLVLLALFGSEHAFHLLERLAADLANLLGLLLGGERGIGTDGLDLRLGVPADGMDLLALIVGKAEAIERSAFFGLGSGRRSGLPGRRSGLRRLRRRIGRGRRLLAARALSEE